MPKAIEPLERKNLLIGAVGEITRFKLKDASKLILSVRNEIENELIANDYLKSAPFKTVSLIFRYGARDNLEPDDYRISKKYNELHVGIEFDAMQLKALEANPEQLREKFRMAVIEVLCDISANYDLPFEFLDAMRPKT